MFTVNGMYLIKRIPKLFKLILRIKEMFLLKGLFILLNTEKHCTVQLKAWNHKL